MHSDFPPPLVYPDTHLARIDAEMHDPNHEIVPGFCRLWKEDTFALPDPNNYRKRCANRDFTGDNPQAFWITEGCPVHARDVLREVGN